LYDASNNTGFLEIFVRNARSNRANVEKRAYKRRLQPDFDAEDEQVTGTTEQEVKRLILWMKSKPINSSADMTEVEQAMTRTYEHRKALIHSKERPTLTEVLEQYPKIIEKSFLVCI
jgi:hypothetical protein